MREGNGTPLQYSYLENPMDGRLQSMELLRVAHNWATSLSLFFSFFFYHNKLVYFLHQENKWQGFSSKWEKLLVLPVIKNFKQQIMKSNQNIKDKTLAIKLFFENLNTGT